MSELRRLQSLHVQCTASLIKFAYHSGLELGWGETLRFPARAQQNEETGAGISNSLHLSGLAVDLHAYRDGVYLTKTEDYAELGAYWISLAPECRWGGSWTTKKDGNHFSITWQNVQ